MEKRCSNCNHYRDHYCAIFWRKIKGCEGNKRILEMEAGDSCPEWEQRKRKIWVCFNCGRHIYFDRTSRYYIHLGKQLYCDSYKASFDPMRNMAMPDPDCEPQFEQEDENE